MTNFQNISNFTNFVQIANTMTSGYLIFGIVVTLFIVAFLSTLHFGKWKALTYASFLTELLIIVLNMNGLMDYMYLTLMGIIFAIGFFMMIQSKQ